MMKSKLLFFSIFCFLVFCRKETNTNTTTTKQETQWCYRNEPCWVIKNGYCTYDPDCVPNSKSLQQIEVLKSETLEKNKKRGECCNGCSVGGTKLVKYECGK